ncbi:MAG: hypothetical protein WC875_03580 [Candidatus Absconditabacterales bacterium]|jgi:hypothetical protein
MKKLFILAVFTMMMVISSSTAKAQTVAATDTIEFSKMDSLVKVAALKWANEKAYGTIYQLKDVKSITGVTYVKNIPSRAGGMNNQYLVEYVTNTDGVTKYILLQNEPIVIKNGSVISSITGPGGDSNNLPPHK